MKELKCTGCGAPLVGGAFFGKYVCQYCGARYEKKAEFNDRIMLSQTEPGYIKMVSAEMAVSYDALAYLGEGNAEELVKEQLAHKIADGLKDFITIRTDDDLIECTRVFQAKLRIVDPKYRAR